MRARPLPIILGIVLSLLIIAGLVLFQKQKTSPPGTQDTNYSSPGGVENAMPKTQPSEVAPGASPGTAGVSAPAASTSGAPDASKATNPNPDLTVDANGLSKATVVVTTSEGVIRFKFYPQDAPNTVKRIIELINQGFYNGLTFHRVVPGFVIQGGDPLGNGTGGSGQKLKAEFNNRHHIEGTVAMARGQDPDSADSQFYFSLGTHPHLDKSYTVFGQAIEGMDVARRIKVGDKIVSIIIE